MKEKSCNVVNILLKMLLLYKAQTHIFENVNFKFSNINNVQMQHTFFSLFQRKSSLVLFLRKSGIASINLKSIYYC